MKYLLAILGLLLFSITGTAQEFEVPAAISLGETADFGLEQRTVPSLSLLAPAIPSQNLTLTEVNFNKEVKREVNLVAVMERERYEKESRYIQLESPMPNISRFEQGMIEVTNDFRMHDRSSNYDIYTGQKKIPAYEDMQVPLFSSPLHSRGRVRGYVSPYTYNPYLR
jgi:hypothetical protein